MTDTDRQAQIEGLRQLADFLEAHPGVEFLGVSPGHFHLCLYAYRDAGVEFLDGLSVADLTVDPAYPELVIRSFGGLRVGAFLNEECLAAVMAGPVDADREAVPA